MHAHSCIFLTDINVLVPGDCRGKPFRMLTFSSALSVLRSLVFHSSLSVFVSPLLPLSFSLYFLLSLYTSLLSYFITLTPTPATLVHMPLDSSPHHPLAPIHSINHSPHSSFFTFSALLYILPTSTYSSIGNLMSCPPSLV